MSVVVLDKDSVDVPAYKLHSMSGDIANYAFQKRYTLLLSIDHGFLRFGASSPHRNGRYVTVAALIETIWRASRFS